MRLIMVLGYLGSGKTTFITNLLKAKNNEKNAVLVNDFGQRDVDGVLLDGKQDIIEKIYDGSIFCSCKSDKFVESMLNIVKKQPDNIIVEASGLANPYTMLRELNLIEQSANVKFDLNVFCLVDATGFEKVLAICHAIKVQTALSDVVVINKTDIVDNTTLVRVEKLLHELTNGLIIKTSNAKLDKYFGYPVVNKPKVQLIEDIALQKLLVKVKDCTRSQLDEVAQKISEVSSRIKGVVNFDGDSYVYEFIDGKSTLIKTDKKDSFLVILSCFRSSLKNSVKDIISKYDFLEIE